MALASRSVSPRRTRGVIWQIRTVQCLRASGEGRETGCSTSMLQQARSGEVSSSNSRSRYVPSIFLRPSSRVSHNVGDAYTCGVTIASNSHWVGPGSPKIAMWSASPAEDSEGYVRDSRSARCTRRTASSPSRSSSTPSGSSVITREVPSTKRS